MIPLLPSLKDLKPNNEDWGKWFNSVRNGVVYGKRPPVTQNITATEGIKVLVVYKDLIIRIQGASAGTIDITVNPQISKGFDGQFITIEGMSNTNKVKLDNGSGLQLTNSASITLEIGDLIKLHYTESRNLWIEDYRSIK